MNKNFNLKAKLEKNIIPNYKLIHKSQNLLSSFRLIDIKGTQSCSWF